MDNLKVHFDGICTHLKADIPPDFGVRAGTHRTVLVQAEQARKIHGQSIPGHFASLKVPVGSILDDGGLEFRREGDKFISKLAGAHIRIENNTRMELSYDPTYDAIPSLKKNKPGLAPLKREVVAGTEAAALFDIDGGALRAKPIHEGAWRAILETTTSDEPVLVITPFGGEEKRLRVSSNTTVTIANTGSGRVKESPYDFYLHYLVFESVPPAPYAPPSTSTDLLGPGCSNSNYP